MIGMSLSHPSGTSGKVEAVSVQPDGHALARIGDKWFPVSELINKRK